MTRAFLKYTSLVLVLALSLCLFSGCELLPDSSTPTGTTEPPQASLPGGEVDPDEAFTAIDPNYFELLCDNCDVTIYTQSRIQVLTFMLISAQPLGKYDVSIGTDQGVTTRVRLIDGKGQMQATMPLNVYLCYQNFDWKAYAQQEQTDPTGARELMAQYQEELDQQKFNRLFSYQVQVFTDNLFANCKDENNQWALPQETVEIQELTVSVKGQRKTYHPKCLRLTSAPLPVQSSTGALYRMYATRGFAVQPSASGQFYYNALWLSWSAGSAPYCLPQEIGLPLQDDVSIGTSPFAVYVGSHRAGRDVLPGNRIGLSPGDTMKIFLNWTDPSKAGELGLTGLSYFALYYDISDSDRFTNSERCCFVEPVMYNIFSNAYEYYAWAQDGVDIMSYYRDYVAVNQEEPQA